MTQHLTTSGAPAIGGGAPATPLPAGALLPAPAGLDPYTRAWTYWAAAVITTFTALEAAALVRAPGRGTLSAQLRRRRALSTAGIVLFGAWATVHIGWQGRES
ncbi:hypothetical protein [Nonomuraea roseoviolacea]|uniref:Uncharacterized protein n=1 Tax=Nonomuraea roseoviolacea subsp. carminata TaxID=160689 RepID=A0ABT1KAM7_9ACTN|nr:hypothetical protein [Nonomuraea roseoviolacea]MCP2350664.1 hypothetical protein [Nonomuraea roseoviolacea subsp. carminata]